MRKAAIAFVDFVKRCDRFCQRKEKSSARAWVLDARSLQMVSSGLVTD
ncbi:MAG: hypothetical protein F6J93_27445 [Oscillatoria sp. SIO1A7]|nr:hypothetical protein [Oscillatoria sp. SIO1A7]